ncbi:NACHT, LRR and PYD domains-containing protein 3-like [Mauremys mutica]|uniref:NACHT, LRR and PYD domains-containing protein 3-like n=1 Tax=Mauremys mutica TaxID=74926 RepID=UPI001D167612|nr:NACHT, LRR and PYD domains-containing protein 3-like [Mauremys mutica]
MENQSRISDLLGHALDNLLEEEFKSFKDKLLHSDFKGKGNISRGQLQNANRIKTKNLLMQFYGAEAAVDVTIDVFTQLNFRDAAEKLREEREKDYQKKYREHMQEEYQVVEDRNAHLGEYVSLDKRYIKLLIVKEHWQREEKEHEIITRGRRHAELMAQQPSLTKISVLFDLNRNKISPKTVVLQGAAGIGKTMTARKIMLDWAAGKLYQKKFDYVFYINCRKINRVTEEQSVADLVLDNCPNGKGPIKEIFEKPEKLLFIIDGFDELNSLLDDEVGLCTDLFEKKPVKTILCSLLRKEVLQKSCLLITTRPTALEKLKNNLKRPCYAEIMGFSGDDRKEYFHKFFCDEKKATQVFNFVKENEILFTMCFIPIVCWIICTVMKQQMERREDLAQTSKTITSVYLLFLAYLLTDHFNDSMHLQESKTNLWKLCSLAADGILEEKILFDEGDLKKYNLSLSTIQSLFLNKNIFKKDIGRESVYSFIHLTFQDFFAALFYVLEKDEETMEKSLTSMNHLLNLYGTSKNNDLMLTVRFLFGLLNKERLNYMEEKLHCKASFARKLDLLKWFEAEAKKISSLPYKTSEELHDQLELFHCLYEIQDEEFAKSAMDNFQEIRLEHIRLTIMDEIALSFCVKNCCSKQSLYLCNCILGIGEREEGWRAKLRKWLFPRSQQTKELRNSTPVSLCQGLKDPNCKLKTISLSSCKLSSAFPENLSPKTLFTNCALEKLDLSANTLGDSGLKPLCEGLKHPHCELQTLLLWQCSLTAACCGDLSAALSTNQSLTELELSGNKLGDSGIRLLCEGLKQPSCKLEKLVVWDCHLTDACCGDLSSLLSTNQSLRELNLSSNNLSYSGVKLLCEGLKHPNCKLEKLDLSENHIDERTTKELDVLQKIKPGLSIVHYTALSPESPGAKQSWVALLLSQRHTYTSKVLTGIAEFLWYIFVLHWEIGLVLLLSMATYWLI